MARLSILDLKNLLESLDRRNRPGWREQLVARKYEEMTFHDTLHDISKREDKGFMREHDNIPYYSGARRSRQYLEEWLSVNAPGRICLDLACGNGETVLRAVRSGASLALGMDISPVSIGNAEHLAETAGIPPSRVHFLVGDGEATGLPDESVDVVTCCGVLHHMDLSYVFPELRRILVPGGRILAYEALNQNPLIRIYRKRTPQMRTRWEEKHILGPAEVEFAGRFFEIGEVRYWNLATILTRFAPRLLPVWEGMDRLLLRLPGLRRMAWMFTFELVKTQPS